KGAVCSVPEILCVCRILSKSWTARSLDRHSIERFITLDELRRDNPGIEAKYPEAFRQAEARGLYYRARYEMQMGEAVRARETMHEIKSHSKLYRYLYWLSWWPWAWRLVHGRTLKRRLTNAGFRIGYGAGHGLKP